MRINLETQLLTQKEEAIKKLDIQSREQELLLANVKSILETESEADAQILRNAGFGNALNAAELQKKKFESIEIKKGLVTNKRVFTLKEIREVAIKYNLRFLPTKYYKADLPANVAQKLREAVELFPEFKEDKESSMSRWDVDNDVNAKFKILAPAESFELQPTPEDPLLFMRLYGNVYYLVTKWGNDLSWSRLLQGPTFKSIRETSTFLSVYAAVFCLLLYMFHKLTALSVGFGILTAGLMAGLVGLIVMLGTWDFVVDDNPRVVWKSKFESFRKNNWFNNHKMIFFFFPLAIVLLTAAGIKTADFVKNQPQQILSLAKKGEVTIVDFKRNSITDQNTIIVKDDEGKEWKIEGSQYFYPSIKKGDKAIVYYDFNNLKPDNVEFYKLEKIKLDTE